MDIRLPRALLKISSAGWITNRRERDRRISIGERRQQKIGRLVDIDDAAGRDNPIEGAECVASRAAADGDNMFDRGLVDVEAGVGDDPTNVFGHLVGTEKAELEYLTPATDGLDDLVRLRGCQHPDHMIRRLLERLQQGVLRAPREHVDLVEDVHLHVARRAEIDLRQKVAHVLDAIVRRGIEFVEIERAPLFDGHTALTYTAGLGVLTQVGAVQRLGEHSGRRGFSRATGPVEHVGVADFLLRDRVLERAHDVMLAPNLGELLRAVAAVERLVGQAPLTLLRTATRNARSRE